MIKYVLDKYGISGEPVPFGDGHINTTYNVDNKYIVQKLNTEVFINPEGVMDNAFLVTEHIRKKLISEGKDPERKTIEFIRTKDGEKLCYDGNDAYRAYKYIGNAYTVSDKKTPDMLYNAAKAIGEFQKLLSDFDAAKLFTVIPDFHNTPKRVENLKKSIARNASGRADKAKDLIDYALSLEDTAKSITDAIADGTVPLRVSHNDTKINNVLFDCDTNEGICLIDLDTVMSGSYLYDFGDAMRFGASSCAEDCADLDKIYFDLDLFEFFTKGYLESAASVLTAREKELIYTSVIIMTYECGIRFLSDFIDGDTYFRTAYPTHNLDRTINQLALVKDMFAKKDKGEAIVKKYL